MSIFKGKTFIFGGWAPSYRLWAAILTVSEGVFCSAAGIWDTPLLIIMKWEKAQACFWKRGSLSLTELIIFSEGVWGLERRAVGDGISVEAGDSWCDELYTVGIHFLIIPLRQSFPIYSPAIKHPPYGTFGIGHYSASQQAGISGEPGHLKCADASVFGTVRGNGRSGLEGLVYAREMSPILFLLQQMLLSMLLIIYCKLILVIGL